MNQIEHDMIVDMAIAREIMEEAIESYKASQNRYYAFITSK